MKRIITTFLIVLSFHGYAQKSLIKGKINGIDKAEINVLVIPIKEGETPIFDTIYCSNGEFKYTLNYNVDMWHLVILSSDEFQTIFGKEKLSNKELKNREIIFFIQPQQEISISASIADFGLNYSVAGNDINTQASQTERKRLPFSEEFNRLTILQEKTLPKSKEFETLEKEIHLVNTQLDSIDLSVIAEHPDWEYSADLLYPFPHDTVVKYYDRFTPAVKNSFWGKHISKALKASEKGSLAPSLSLPDIDNKIISLYDFRGKYIAIDFWGTWCGYCIKELPKLKEYYSKYKDKIEFISINCRDDKNSWLKAIAKYDMNWINLFASSDEITDLYGVTGYPTKLLIDKDGKIIIKTIGENEEFYKKIDEIFK